MTRLLPLAATAGLAALAAFGVATTTGKAPARPSWALTGHYAPKIRPANFVRAVNNRYFPLKPGTRWHYVGHKGKTRQVDNVVVTHRVKRILRVRCTVVEDTVLQRGKAIERTFDFYAQDRHRNVWYMGENSLERRHGHLVRASDSWKAGVKGAKPGIIMRGHPRRGDVYRQEYYRRGDALDQARVLGTQPLVTLEWSPTEPQFEKKTYVAGVGEIAERVTQGGNEGFRLVSVMRP